MKFKGPRGIMGKSARSIAGMMRSVAVGCLAIGGSLVGTLAHGAGGIPAEFTVWRPQTGYFYSDTLAGVTTAKQWGESTDIPVVGDFDGDGKKDFAVWRPSTGYWYIVQSSNGEVVAHQWGASTDVPVVGDFDGDGKADIAVWRPSTGFWYIIQSSNGQVVARQWGAPTDVPVIGDFDGDGKTDIAVWRPSTGFWYIVQSSNNEVVAKQWGAATDVPVAGDFDGDGKTDIAVWRPSTGFWYIVQSSNNAVVAKQWGEAGDIPVPQDYDGDGKTDIAVWRPSTGFWYVAESSNGATIARQWGASTDLPENGSLEPEALSTSGGSGTVTVPNVVGDTQAAATNALNVAGLAVGTVTEAASSSIASGDVISESPAAGSSVAKNSAVALVISTGPGGGGGGTTTGFWLPYSATATQSDGKTGLFVIPSSNLSAAPVFVTSAQTTILAIAPVITVSGSLITSDSPGRLMYTATGADAKIHVYGLDLTTTSVPVPVQIGNLSLSDGQLCNGSGTSAETNIFQPSTLFVMLQVNANASNCGVSGDVYEIVNYSDSPTTAPSVVPVTSNLFTPMYHSTGALAGLVLQQGSNLDFFPNKTFTSPTVLVSGVVSSDDLTDTTTSGQNLDGEAVSFFTVTNASNTQVYRITTAATATSVYTGSANTGLALEGSPTGDANSVFFTDSTATALEILRAPISSGGAVLLYTEDLTAGSYQLIGSNGTRFAYLENSSAGNAIVKTISATTPSSPTTIATFTGLVGDFASLAEATAGTLSSAQILLNLANTADTTKSSAALAFDGTFTQPTLANSEFQADSFAFLGVVYQTRGLTGTTDDGGASVNIYTVSSATAVPLTLAGGATYKVPTGTNFIIASVSATASDTIGEAVMLTSAGLSAAAATDSASHLIVPLSFPDTQIDFY